MATFYALPKLILDNELKDLWRSENPDSPEFTRYNRFSGIRSQIDRFYTETKFASNTKTNHVLVSFTDNYNAIFIDRIRSITIIGKGS